MAARWSSGYLSGAAGMTGYNAIKASHPVRENLGLNVADERRVLFAVPTMLELG